MADREQILVVDDEQAVLRLIELLLEADGYRCAVASSAAAALEVVETGRFAVALCDMSLPSESGLELARKLCARDPQLAVVMVTAVDDPEVARIAVENGAYGYVVKPFTPSALRIAVVNALHRRALEIENRRHREHLSELVRDRTIELERAVARLAMSERALRRSREEAIQRLARAVALRDGETGGHIERMGGVCGRVARTVGLPPDVCELIQIASPLHDIGKIGIPDAILRNADPLTPGEWEIIRQHPAIGYEILAGSGEDLLDLAASMALTHHERVDGSGYPHGLRSQEIPIEGRIVAVADVFDALTSDRIYQPSRPVDEALEILADGRGTLYDSTVLDAFLATVEAEIAVAGNGSSRSDAAVTIRS